MAGKQTAQQVMNLLDELMGGTVAPALSRLKADIGHYEDTLSQLTGKPPRPTLESVELIDCLASVLGTMLPLARQLLSDQQQRIEALERAPVRRASYERDGSATMIVSQFKTPLGETIGGYVRRQPFIVVEWDCQICGKHQRRSQLPGLVPKYCQPPQGQKLSSCQREARRRAVAAHRGRSGGEMKHASSITGGGEVSINDEKSEPPPESR